MDQKKLTKSKNLPNSTKSKKKSNKMNKKLLRKLLPSMNVCCGPINRITMIPSNYFRRRNFRIKFMFAENGFHSSCSRSVHAHQEKKTRLLRKCPFGSNLSWIVFHFCPWLEWEMQKLQLLENNENRIHNRLWTAGRCGTFPFWWPVRTICVCMEFSLSRRFIVEFVTNRCVLRARL